MKKLILTLTAIFTLAIAAIGFAADGGDLNITSLATALTTP